MAGKLTIHDFAREIGVSTATIWRAVHGEKGISPGTRTMVLDKMAELGYQPSQAARALVTGRSRMVGLLMQSIWNTFDAMVIRQMHEQALAHKYTMVVQDLELDPQFQGIPGVVQLTLDGLIVHGATPELRRMIEEGRLPAAALVSIGSAPERNVDYVRSDLKSGAEAAVRHLVAVGCRRIAFVSPVHGSVVGDSRHDGYVAEITAAGLTPIQVIMEDASRAAASRAIQDYISGSGVPDGVFCYNDDAALGVYRGLCEMSLRAPEDVALVGCDGIEDTEYLERPISTIVQPVRGMCAIAWRFLERRMRDPGIPHQRMVLQPRLSVRASSRRS
jgi:DNA-binding LacI/PurR family transcriptional regulator